MMTLAGAVVSLAARRAAGSAMPPTASAKPALEGTARLNPPNVLMVFPLFNPNSFWNLQAVCDTVGARCPAPPLGLITVAALLPQDWNFRLVNRNAEELTAADLDWADLVMTGGMIVQQADTLALIDLCRRNGKLVAVGGPDAMSTPDIYQAADFRVLGEAEGLIDKFVDDWRAGATQGTYHGEKFQADVSKSPVPRFDLLKREHYLYVGVQFSRGCPFNCEFCDIIELYGRVPRAKTNEQMLGELQRLYDIGHRGHVDFVDDNLIGNKKALKRLLPELIKWQRERGYPFQFSTEASMNLADDAQLLQMLREANFFAIFVGIESPDTETLISTQKKQNTRRSLADSVHKIYEAGMFVIAGFIVGFDTEKNRMAEAMAEAIEAMAIPVCMIGLLTALPNTQLTRRLEREGRFLQSKIMGDQATGGLNFVPLRPRRDILTDFRAILKAVYDPEAYFGRVRAVGRALNRPVLEDAKPNPKAVLGMLRILGKTAWQMTVKKPELRRHFWRTVIDCLRNNPRALEYVMMMMIFYLHVGYFAQFLIKDLDRQLAQSEVTFDPKPVALPEPISA